MDGRFTGRASAAEALALLMSELATTQPLEGEPQITMTLKQGLRGACVWGS